jgi:hypothetical protein
MDGRERPPGRPKKNPSRVSPGGVLKSPTRGGNESEMLFNAAGSREFRGCTK